MGEDVLGTPTTIVTCWAEIRSLMGREFEAIQQKFAEARLKIRIRQTDTAIQRKDYFTWGSRTIDILDIEDPTGERKEMVLYCREIPLS
jgi:SPP1 family predicted phage head-tail adaptor